MRVKKKKKKKCTVLENQLSRADVLIWPPTCFVSHLVQLLCAGFFLHSQLRCSLAIGILQSFELIGHIEVISVERRLKSSFNSQMYLHFKDVIYILAILREVLDSPYFCSSAELCSFGLFCFVFWGVQPLSSLVLSFLEPFQEEKARHS